jgi:hypothetical protein
LRYNEHLLGVSLATLPWRRQAVSRARPQHHLVAGVLPQRPRRVRVIRRFVADRLFAFAYSLVFACSFYVMLHAHGHLHLIWSGRCLPSALLLSDGLLTDHWPPPRGWPWC